MEFTIYLSRLFWNCAGLLALALGIIGIFLPVLPTTPFILLASACLLRGSPKMYAKLVAHPKFGPVIKNWNENRSISKKVKKRAYLFIFLSFAVSIYAVPLVSVKWLLLLILVLLITWFYRIPSQEYVDESAQNH